MSTQATPYQIELLQHTLGLSGKTRGNHTPHRNHFVAGNGHHDMKHLEALEGLGLMERRPSPGFLVDGDIVFAATDIGRSTALAALPEPKPRTKYEDYLDADGCAGRNFGEFLCGGRLPEYESRQAYGNAPRDRRGYEYRMFRRTAWIGHWSSVREVEGDWCKTMKEAKASYKAALKRHHEKLRAAQKRRPAQ
ncbi:hypothetical protein [Paraburkholderia sp. C35]|uniref:hypothetical protein n=1 Tax=Paraburkholderia sp. C35 TaxID=2126993 RepID=UPI000D69438C|nr:hypothetical protein [Paraburkholderia sp. C35]